MTAGPYAVKKLCIVPNLSGIGGPASFTTMFTSRLAGQGVCLTNDPAERGIDSMLVIGGSRHLGSIWQAKRRGVRIVQRLNGMNWLHKRVKSSPKYYLRAELNNRLLATIRRHLADHIIYQSIFSQDWWQTVFQRVSVGASVIYNGVDLQKFSPQGVETPPADRVVIQLLEARISGGYEAGLMNAVALCNTLAPKLEKPLELRVIGKVSDAIRSQVQEPQTFKITWTGMVAHEQIPALNRSAHLLFSADLNAACPNSVLEALACGLPVIAYATGSLPELVGESGGAVAPYGANYWKLEPPVPDMLAQKTLMVLNDLDRCRSRARQRAIEYFDADKITADYLDVLFRS